MVVVAVVEFYLMHDLFTVAADAADFARESERKRERDRMDFCIRREREVLLCP